MIVVWPRRAVAIACLGDGSGPNGGELLTAIVTSALVPRDE